MKPTRLFVSAAAVSITVISLFTGARGAPVVVGVASVEVTPREPVHLINEAEPIESEGVEQGLFAKAIAFGADSEAGGPAVLLSFDGIGVPGGVAEEAARRLETRFAIPRERIAVCATHTHWAPHLKGLLGTIFGGPLPGEHQARVDAYTEQLTDGLEEAAVKALVDRRPGRVEWAVGRVTFAENRRLEGEGRLMTDEALMVTWNPDGPVDHDLPVLAVRDGDGTLRALHFTYACHNVAVTGREISQFKNRVHGDWAGLAQEMIAQRHPGVFAMCTIGCGGDARPTPVGGIGVAEAHAREIAAEIDALLADPSRWKEVSGALRCRMERVDLPLEPLPDEETLLKYVRDAARSRNMAARGHLARQSLNRISRGETPESAVPFSAQSWIFGEGPAMVFLAGEVVADFKLRIAREHGEKQPWVVAYANATPCYIVSKRMLEAGGYEAGNSMYYYGWLTSLTPSAEDLVMESVAEVLKD